MIYILYCGLIAWARVDLSIFLICRDLSVLFFNPFNPLPIHIDTLFLFFLFPSLFPTLSLSLSYEHSCDYDYTWNIPTSTVILSLRSIRLTLTMFSLMDLRSAGIQCVYTCQHTWKAQCYIASFIIYNSSQVVRHNHTSCEWCKFVRTRILHNLYTQQIFSRFHHHIECAQHIF